MQSTSQSGSNDAPGDRVEPDSDSPTSIPGFARAWESARQVASSVRRPSTLPDPASYHQAIDPQAIFELDETQDDGSIETILVVAFSCKRCRHVLKQACSRMRPVCARCGNAQRCDVSQGGYQRLPGPKVAKPSLLKSTMAQGTREESITASAQVLPTSRLRVRRTVSRAVSFPTGLSSDSDSEFESVTPGSKRPLSPEYASVPPRKKAPAKTTSRKGKARCTAPPASSDMDISSDSSSSAREVPARQRGVPKWTFVKRDTKSSQGQEHAPPTPSNSQVPRVWTNSIGGLLTAFPELSKSTIGFSWFQSETPTLLLDPNYVRSRWINSTTLTFDLSSDFICDDSELEPIVKSNTTEPFPQPHSHQPLVHSLPNTLNFEIEKMGLHYSYSPPGHGWFPRYESVSAPLPTLGMQMPPLGGIPQDVYLGAPASYAGGTSLMYHAIQGGSASANRSTQLYPSDLHFQNPQPSHPCLIPDGFPTQSMIPKPDIQPRIPLDKPPAVETLSDSHLRFIPLLLWISRDSELAPSNLPSEYAYLCMGLFFISDLQHEVIHHGVSSTGLVQGQVCWSVTLQWAPGGEDALFDRDSAPSSSATDSAPAGATKDLLHPWWLDPPVTSSQAENTTPDRPRDLRMQFFSFIPLDLLAEFHPSESFPRGWFCKSCGMINIQIYFRHQICQSTTCKSLRDKHIPPGKVNSLSSLRDPYQSSSIVRPTSNIPSAVVSESEMWDDGMQSWIHSVKNGVTLCHIFTGNQGYLQTDATALLEAIQCEVLLRKEEHPSPYFTHSTKLLHPSDGSETMVPGGTPNCVRTAYYTLCDFVHRYAEMDKPRFGEVRIQAWVSSGSSKGNVFHASKSPVVVHCLGVQMVLNLTPKGGYEDIAKTTALDKGKGRATDQDRIGSQSPEPRAGPSRHLEQDNGNQTPIIFGLEANETPTVAENVDEAIAVMDTMRQYSSHDAGAAIPDSNINGTEAAQQEVVERRVRKKNKVTRDKTKASVPEISMTLVHGDCVVLSGDDFEYKIVRTGTTILVIGLPEET